MKKLTCISVLATIALLLSACSEKPSDLSAESKAPEKETQTSLQMQTFLRETLALAQDVEVVMSYLEIPKNTTLPMHFHPGEEFAYVLEGSGVLELEGEGEKVIHAQEMGMVPFRQHHSFKTLEEGARLLVFRVHEKGQPERFLVEQ